jgi:hypothetical protein
MTRADPFASALLTGLAAAASVGAYRLGLDDVPQPWPGLHAVRQHYDPGLIALGRLAHAAVVVAP